MPCKTLHFWHTLPSQECRDRSAKGFESTALTWHHSWSQWDFFKADKPQSISQAAARIHAPELLRKADGLRMGNGSSWLSGFQQDTVEEPNSLLFDRFHLAGKGLFFPKASLYSNLPRLWQSGGGSLWSLSVLLFGCGTVVGWAFWAFEEDAGPRPLPPHEILKPALRTQMTALTPWASSAAYLILNFNPLLPVIK